MSLGPAMRRAALRLVLAAGLVLGACADGRRAPDGPPPRNLLIVSIDTLRADYLGCYGDAAASTGTLDALAAEGVRFEAAIAPTPLTLPSHATLLTGLQPWSHGARHNGIYRLADRFETLAERLAAAGFDTAAVVGGYPLVASSGLAQGFAHYDDAIPLEGAQGYHSPERRAAEITDAGRAWLARRAQAQSPAPFFLFVHYYDPHVPYDPPAEYMPQPGVLPPAEEGFAAYRGEIAYVDDQIGRLLQALGDAGALERTLVIVTADHGEGLMQHQELTHGVFLYEELVRVPLLLRYPAALPAGARARQVAGLADVLPTALEALGLDPGTPTDGRSLWEVARSAGTGGGPEGGEAFAESHFGRLEFGWAPLRAVRTSAWKYIDAPEPELYHLADDPGETRNLVAEQQEIATGLRARLERAFADPAADTPSEIGDEELARLRSLGYLQGAAATAPASEHQDRALPDPKRMIPQYTQLQIASFELMQGRVAEAERRLSRLAAADPGNVTARCRLADALVARGELAQAERVLRQALSIADERGRPQVLWGLAGLARRRGDHDEALALYRRRAEIAPLDARAVDMMSRTLQLAGRTSEAEALVREWLERQPSSLTGWRALARLLDATGRAADAREAWRRVLELRGTDAEAAAALAAP